MNEERFEGVFYDAGFGALIQLYLRRSGRGSDRYWTFREG